jgi:hypothetical protein
LFVLNGDVFDIVAGSRRAQDAHRSRDTSRNLRGFVPAVLRVDAARRTHSVVPHTMPSAR